MSKYYLNNDKIYNILIILFPLILIIGSAAVNFFLILISFFTIYEIYKRSEILNPIKNIFWTFGLFYLFLIISSFYAENFIEAFRASFSQIRFFLFTIFVYYFFKPEKYLKLLIKFWTILIVLVSLDTLLQFFSGIDIFGYKAEGYIFDKRNFLSPNIGRLGGPFGDELIVGAFLAKISSPIIIYYLGMIKFYDFKNKILVITTLTLLILTILASGERTSLLIIFTCLTIFLLFQDIKKLFIFISTLIIFILIIYSNNNFFKNRANDTLQIIKDIPKSSYGRIYHSSIEVWKKNKLIGTGLKNYHVNCVLLKDPNPSNSHNFCSPNHSHNFFLQILVETGILGIIFLYVFIFYLFKSFYKKVLIIKTIKDKYKYFASGSLFIVAFTVFPSIIPSGSFFTTWNGSFFWLHMGFILNFFIKINKNQ